jgi:hypothetical protein
MFLRIMQNVNMVLKESLVVRTFTGVLRGTERKCVHSKLKYIISFLQLQLRAALVGIGTVQMVKCRVS